MIADNSNFNNNSIFRVITIIKYFMNDQLYKIFFLLQGLARVSASVGHATIIWGNKHTAVSFRFDTKSLCQRLYVLTRVAF